MSVPRFTRTVSPRQRVVYAAQVRHALAQKPDATLDEIAKASDIPRSIIQVIAARVRKAAK